MLNFPCSDYWCGFCLLTAPGWKQIGQEWGSSPSLLIMSYKGMCGTCYFPIIRSKQHHVVKGQTNQMFHGTSRRSKSLATNNMWQTVELTQSWGKTVQGYWWSHQAKGMAPGVPCKLVWRKASARPAAAHQGQGWCCIKILSLGLILWSA